MTTRDLLAAFNEAAGPRFQATDAYLRYEREDGAEWQVIEFKGLAADGTPFSYKTPRLGAGASMDQAARDAAAELLKQESPQP